MNQAQELPDAANGGFPAVVEPSDESRLSALRELVARRRDELQQLLRDHGALLFRGWELRELDEFRAVVEALSRGAPSFDYAGGASPRNGLGSGVYSSTEYPPHIGLSLHNELSYADLYPSILYFFCLVAPLQGGETTIGDSRRILGRIDPELADEFRAKGLRYIRNLSGEEGSGYSWQEAFATSDPAAAEARCTAIGASFEWHGSTLRMSQIRPATAIHPETGDEVWFNQADGFHPSALDPQSYQELLALVGSEERFRLNVTFGDGSPIGTDALAHIRSVITRETIPHRWKEGDVLVLDNLLAAHGRRPFSGPRRIALAMT